MNTPHRDVAQLSPLKASRLLRKLNKSLGLPGHATFSELMARVNRLKAQALAATAQGQGEPAADGVDVAGRAHALEADRLTSLEQLALGLQATACAGALRAHAQRKPVVLPEPLDAVRRAARTGDAGPAKGPVLR